MELKSCPFCGGKATTGKIEYNATYYVRCSNTKICSVLPFTLGFDEIEDAINAWNKRAE